MFSQTGLQKVSYQTVLLLSCQINLQWNRNGFRESGYNALGTRWGSSRITVWHRVVRRSMMLCMLRIFATFSKSLQNSSITLFQATLSPKKSENPVNFPSRKIWCPRWISACCRSDSKCVKTCRKGRVMGHRGSRPFQGRGRLLWWSSIWRGGLGRLNFAWLSRCRRHGPSPGPISSPKAAH